MMMMMMMNSPTVTDGETKREKLPSVHQSLNLAPSQPVAICLLEACHFGIIKVS
jgi:hypothetical protein